VLSKTTSELPFTNDIVESELAVKVLINVMEPGSIVEKPLALALNPKPLLAADVTSKLLKLNFVSAIM
jgi:hypothetical protein